MLSLNTTTIQVSQKANLSQRIPNLLNLRQNRCGILFWPDRKPGQVKLPLKPGQLALCELMGADFYQLDSVRKGADPLQVIDYLSVPQRLPRGRVLRESALQQGRGFLDQP